MHHHSSRPKICADSRGGRRAGRQSDIARVDLQNGANTRYYVLDARGHARAMVDSTGSVTDYYEHDAWGNLLPGSYGSTPNPFKWNAAAGYQHVPFTGLYHVGAREYDPRTARWLQRDPIGQSSGDPNLYRYCGNDAVNLSDPSGLQPPTSEYDPFEGVGLRLNENGSVARVSPLNNKGRRQATHVKVLAEIALEVNPVSNVPRALGYCDSRLEQGLAIVGIAGGAGGAAFSGLGSLVRGTKVVSKIKNSKQLIKYADQAGKSPEVQRDLDRLVSCLKSGRFEAGIGARQLEGKARGIWEMRTRNGARVYYRIKESMIEILGKSDKNSQKQVIAILENLYGK